MSLRELLRAAGKLLQLWPLFVSRSLSLGDFMNLAYTLSTMYKRLHPSKKEKGRSFRCVRVA